MQDLSQLTDYKLQAYLLNAVKHAEKDPDAADEIIAAVVEEISNRDSSSHLLTRLGYNVRWKTWRAKERRVLLAWIIDVDLPDKLVTQTGSPRTRTRVVFVGRTISNWLKYYGRAPNMEQACARWGADLEYLRGRYRSLIHDDA